jgi:amino acid permease
MIIYAGVTSALGLYFLSQCAERVGGRNHTFSSLSQVIWPKLGVVFDAAVAIKCLGVATSYLIIIGDIIPQVSLISEEERIYHTNYRAGASFLFPRNKNKCLVDGSPMLDCLFFSHCLWTSQLST